MRREWEDWLGELGRSRGIVVIVFGLVRITRGVGLDWIRLDSIDWIWIGLIEAS